MTKKCNKKNCSAPRGFCANGELEHRSCEIWLASQADASAPTTTDDDREGIRLPWSGDTFGKDDISFLSGVRRPFVVGVLGSYNAGKTTMLAALYLLLLRGSKIGTLSISGSNTLAAWERIAHRMRWKDVEPPDFPEHTELGSVRQPGLLHLGVADESGWIRDILLSDAPGEWFNAWSTHAEDPLAAGARWIADNSDAFLFIVDSAALAGDKPASERDKLTLLAQRLRDVLNARPVAIVNTKSDIKVPFEIATATETDLARDLPTAPSINVSVATKSQPEVLFADLLDWLGDVIRTPRPMTMTEARTNSGDSLFNYYGRIR